MDKPDRQGMGFYVLIQSILFIHVKRLCFYFRDAPLRIVLIDADVSHFFKVFQHSRGAFDDA